MAIAAVVHYRAPAMALLRALKALFGGTTRPRPPDYADARRDPWGAIASALADVPTPVEVGALLAALRELDARDALDLSRLAELLDPWYAAHPIVPRWRNEYDLEVVDPLALDINDVAAAADDPTLPRWASRLRSLEVVDDGALVFHHGFSAGELLEVLCDPHTPGYEALRVTLMNDWTDAELRGIVDHVAHHPSMTGLRHLGLGACAFGPEHVIALLESERAAQLVSLDLGERLLDHDDDAIVDALGRMGRLRAVEHLCLYNDVHTAAHLRALVAHELPRLTHLSIGSAEVDDDFVDALIASGAFPALKALALRPWPPRLAAWADDRGIRRGLGEQG